MLYDAEAVVWLEHSRRNTYIYIIKPANRYLICRRGTRGVELEILVYWFCNQSIVSSRKFFLLPPFLSSKNNRLERCVYDLQQVTRLRFHVSCHQISPHLTYFINGTASLSGRLHDSINLSEARRGEAEGVEKRPSRYTS